MSDTSHSARVFSPEHLIKLLFRRMKMIVGITLFFCIVGATYVSFQTPYYTSTALIQLNTPERSLISTDTLTLSQSQDEAAVQSELDILKSPELALRVIDKLDMEKRAEFNPDYKSKTKLRLLKIAIQDALEGPSTAETDSERAAEVLQVQVLRRVLDRLSLRKDPLSYTVHISFTSELPRRAKLVANTFATEYMAYQIESREESNRQANAWLSQRVDELRRAVIESENAVQNFKTQNNLFQSRGMTLSDQQVSELNTELVQARSDLAQTQARLEQAEKLLASSAGGSVPEVLSSSLIQRLREQEADLLRERSDLAQHFGRKHPRMESVNGEISNLRGKIAYETRKIVDGLKNEAEIAKARIDALELDLGTRRGELGVTSKQEIQLSDLEREAEANRTLYESFLGQMKETGEAIQLEQTNAKIIAHAQLPLAPSAPNKKLILFFFVMTGGFIAGTLALALEFFARGFGEGAQIEEQFGIETIGMVPDVTKSLGRSLPDLAQGDENSIYTEALRRIAAGIEFSDDTLRSLMVVSSLPQEGKGWIAASLARVLAKTGKRVLLIDCDLHRHNLCGTLGVETTSTLNDYLDGAAEIAQIVTPDAEGDLEMIGSVPLRKNIQKSLESKRMQALMSYAHEHYDFVIMDAPPVIGLSDVFFLSKLVDSALFVVQWQKTPRHIVGNALRLLARARVKLVGAVLSRMDVDAYKKQEFGSSHGYQAYGDYYDAPNSKKIVKFKKAAR